MRQILFHMMIKRHFLPFWEWEESKTAMWGCVDNRTSYLQQAIEFTGDAELYGAWMLRVIEAWPNSCLHNLSNLTQNRRAWIGHAACALAFNCPEDIVRQAWGFLSEQQQVEANQKADEAIKKWEGQYAKEAAWDGCVACIEWANSQHVPIF